VPEHDWSACLEFARAVSLLMVEHDPSRYTTDFRKAGREGKVLVDYLRNNRTNTSACAYSVRARAGAPVSVPISWVDLKPSLRPDRFTVKTMRGAVARRGADPWREYWRSKQRLELPG
jgi:bifunctional non-homologous end joining protein LigD